ncbi:hypothetical protein EYF80_040273 [Liparis tanakae]|uniref:Uncharacterized protein n=1 Tax=Liparis tanakae TaxID=230148 RepID=A0A4Z2G989_9TELE|nr:hypothetical protein EYF80_040273 [Liparis tanakae]
MLNDMSRGGQMCLECTNKQKKISSPGTAERGKPSLCEMTSRRRVGERTQQDSNPATSSVWIYANGRTYKYEDCAGTLSTGPSTYRTRVK